MEKLIWQAKKSILIQDKRLNSLMLALKQCVDMLRLALFHTQNQWGVTTLQKVS